MDLSDGEPFAVTYEAANDFKFHSNNSVEIQHPLTANNLRAIENNNILVNDSQLPYNLIDASIEVDGIDMKIESAVLLGVSNVIRVKYFGGNITLFSSVKDKSIQELDLSAYDHTRNWAYIAGALNETAGIMYPIIDYGNLTSLNDNIEIEDLYPGMFVHTLVSKIASEISYTLSGSLLTDAQYLKLFIPFCNKNSYVDPAVITSLLFEAYYPTNFTADFAGMFSMTFPTEISDVSNRFDGQYYKALITGLYTFHLNFRILVSDPDTEVTVSIKRLDPYAEDPILQSFELGDFTHVGGTLYELDTDLTAFNMVKDHMVYISVAISNGITVLGDSTHSKFSLVSITNTSVGYGEFWAVAPNLPDIKQGDLIKYVLNTLGCIIQCDDATKTITITKIETIIDNTFNGTGLDWSSKHDITTPDITFSQKVAQINHLKYKDEENVIKPTGTDYDLIINNKALEAEKDLYTAPFGASEVTQVFTFDQDVWRIDINGASNIMPRILVSNYITLDGTYHYKYNGSNQATETEGNVPYFITDSNFNLGFDNNLRQGKMKYSLDLLINPKQLRAKIRLTPLDINTLDFSKPVWLDYHQCWFYISKISQFKYGVTESTICELIKLL